MIDRFINNINNALYGYILIVLLIACGLYFTFRTGFAQFRLFGWQLRAVAEKPSDKDGVSAFQALMVSTASRVGTGNIIGVSTALCLGGFGSVFWMWVIALIGSASAFVESTLAQIYKVRDPLTGGFRGGPAYYMQQGLHRKWMGVLFAVLITITFGMANQVVQSNTLCDALSDTLSLDRRWVGATLTLATLAIIFGGIKRISRFSSIIVPFMAIGYAIIALFVILSNLTSIPSMLALIVREAFGIDSALGGAVGIAITQGVKRGLFSNEAGEGSAPNAAAIAHTSHPVKQGLLQALGVFTDTIVVCTCTASIILLSGIYDSGRDGIILTKYALETHIGPAGGLFITAAIFFFAYSTIIANYFYGETNIRFITSKKSYVNIFRIVTAATVMAGALISLQEAWSIVDLAMGIMTLVNLAAIIQLSPKVFFLLNDYMRQRKQGHDPVFSKEMMKEGKEDVECW